MCEELDLCERTSQSLKLQLLHILCRLAVGRPGAVVELDDIDDAAQGSDRADRPSSSTALGQREHADEARPVRIVHRRRDDAYSRTSQLTLDGVC